MQGLHVTGDLYECSCSQALLTDEALLMEQCRKALCDAGLTIVGEHYCTFPEFNGQPGGVTGMVLLAESHLAIHTWPERRGVTLDIYVCNFTQDNSNRAGSAYNDLIKAFNPKTYETNRFLRGK